MWQLLGRRIQDFLLNAALLTAQECACSRGWVIDRRGDWKEESV